MFPKLIDKAILAPMAGITNLPFRMLCKDYGAAAVVTEMVSSTAIVRNSKATQEIAMTLKDEQPVGLQLFGNNIEYLKQAAEMMQHKFDFIDINMGCSVKKILDQKAGSYLMKDPKKAGKLISTIVDAIEKPLTIKIRNRYKKINAIEIAKIAEQNGASAITVHPRDYDQGFTGKSDWNTIRKVKEAINIPVIGNGDIWNPIDAKRMIDETGCDYVMIGRGAMGNPFIFKEINEHLKGNIVTQSLTEKRDDFFKYLKYCRKYNILTFNDIRTKAMHFTKSITGSTRIRYELGKAKNIEEIEKVMQ